MARHQTSQLASRLLIASQPVWRTHKPKALIVDDDPDVHPLVERALSQYSIASEGVNDGATALERLRTGEFSLIVLDLVMEGMSGHDVLRAIRKERRLRELPVIIMSANFTDDALARSFGYGADDFVVKPFRTSTLAMRAYRLLYPLEYR